MPLDRHRPHPSGGIEFYDGGAPDAAGTVMAPSAPVLDQARRLDYQNGLTNAPAPGSAEYMAQLRADQGARMVAGPGGGAGGADQGAGGAPAAPMSGGGGAPMAAPMSAPMSGLGGAPGAPPPLDTTSTGAEGGAQTEAGRTGGGGAPGDMAGPPPAASGAGPARPPPGGIRFAGGGGGGAASEPDYGTNASRLYHMAALQPSGGGGGASKRVKVETGEQIMRNGTPSADTMARQDEAAQAQAAAAREAVLLDSRDRDIGANQVETQKNVEAIADANVSTAERRGQAAQRAIETQRQEKYEEMASAKIDPDHFWGSRSTGQRVAGTIGLLLGDIGAGLSGGKNYAREAVNSAIDRDIDAQKLNLEKKKGELSYLGQVYADAKAKTGSDKAAALEAKQVALHRLSLDVQQTALRSGSTRAQQQAQVIDAQLLAEQAKLRAESDKTIQDYHAYGFQQTVGGGGGLTLKQRAELEEKAAEAAKKFGGGTDGLIVGDRFVPFAPGLGEGDKAEMRKRAIATNNASAALDRMEREGGFSTTYGDAHSRAAAQGFTYHYMQATGQGQSTKDNEESVGKNLLGAGPKGAEEYRGSLRDMQAELEAQASAGMKK